MSEAGLRRGGSDAVISKGGGLAERRQQRSTHTYEQAAYLGMFVEEAGMLRGR